MSLAPAKETKSQKFHRLMNVRLLRALEEIRLVTQLSGKTYANTEEEAEAVIRHLDGAVHNVAKAYRIPYSTAIGEDAQRAAATGHLVTGAQAGPIDEIDIARAIEFINAGEPETAKGLLKAALRREQR